MRQVWSHHDREGSLGRVRLSGDVGVARNIDCNAQAFLVVLASDIATIHERVAAGSNLGYKCVQATGLRGLRASRHGKGSRARIGVARDVSAILFVHGNCGG